jgi:hypothetical protein
MARHHIASRRGLGILLGITIVLAVLTALFLILQDHTSAQVSVASPVLIGGGQSAREARRSLEKWTTSWAEEVVLVTASSSMIKDSDRDPWTFLVYAPRRGRIAVVTIMGSEVLVLRERSIVYAQPSIDDQAWQIDSDEALERWWQQTGYRVWERPDAHSLHIRLGLNKENVVAWRISVLDAEGQILDLWEMRADTGDTTGVYVGEAHGDIASPATP